MDFATLVTHVKQSLVLVLVLSLPAVLAAGITGLVVAFLQAVTQVQDQTLLFGIKLIAVIIVIAATSGWLGGELYNFADQMLAAIASVK